MCVQCEIPVIGNIFMPMDDCHHSSDVNDGHVIRWTIGKFPTCLPFLALKIMFLMLIFFKVV